MSEGWHDYEQGRTRGQYGPEEGIILRDEELGDEEEGADARITLERGSSSAPFALTSTVYGWMLHTRSFASEEEANRAYEAMKPEIAHLTALIPYEGDRDVEGKARQLSGSYRGF